MCSLSNIFACTSSITKNVGAILIQNEDLKALQITGTMNHIIALSVTQCLSKWHYNYYSVQNRVVYRPPGLGSSTVLVLGTRT